MEKMGSMAKAICLVLGGLALVGLLFLLSPLIAGILGILAGLVEITLPILLVVGAIYIIYRVIEEKRKGTY